MWARAYRDSVYHAAVDTKNGTEALNKVLKYKYLPKQKHMTLSHVITSITGEFLPELHYKYVFKNFKQDDLYRSYNPSVVPPYLQGQPKQTILHCLHRKASSNKFTPSDVCQVSPNCGKFEVKAVKVSMTSILEAAPLTRIVPVTGLLTICHVSTSLPCSSSSLSGDGKNYLVVT